MSVIDLGPAAGRTRRRPPCTGILYGFPLGGCGAATCSYTYINSFVDQIWTAPTLANGLAYVRLDIGGTDVESLHYPASRMRSRATLLDQAVPRR